MIYIGLARPFKSMRENDNELFIEFLICLLTTLYFTFTQFLGDPFVKYQIGWVYILLFILVILNKMGIVVYKSLRRILLKLIYCKDYASRKINKVKDVPEIN